MLKVAEFAEAVYNAIKETCGSAAEQTQWDYVDPVAPYGILKANALEAVLSEMKSTAEIDALLDQLRNRVQPFGCLPFFQRARTITASGILEDSKAVVIHALGILEIADVTCLTSAGANYDIDDETIRNTFDNWDKRYGLTVLEVSNAFLRLRFQTVPENPKAFLKEIVKLCPTILEVTETKAEYQRIIQDLRDGHVLDLWWD